MRNARYITQLISIWVKFIVVRCGCLQVLNTLRVAVPVILATFVIAGYAKEPVATWHMINVNRGQLQGDANLIKIGKQTLMIDAGYYTEARSSVLPYLEKLGITKIDHFFVSHLHKDHYEGLFALFDDNIDIDNLYLRIPPSHFSDQASSLGDLDMKSIERLMNTANKRDITIHSPSTGFLLKLPNNSYIEVLHAQDAAETQDHLAVNDLSLIMKWTIDQTRVLFTGDLGFKVGTLLSTDRRIESEILKMPHHGGIPIPPNAFYERVDPKYVLVPSPRSVWCGDLAERSRKWVNQKNIPIWINGVNGHIVVDFYGNKVIFSPEIVSGECKNKAFGRVEWKN